MVAWPSSLGSSVEFHWVLAGIVFSVCDALCERPRAWLHDYRLAAKLGVKGCFVCSKPLISDPSVKNAESALKKEQILFCCGNSRHDIAHISCYIELITAGLGMMIECPKCGHNCKHGFSLSMNKICQLSIDPSTDKPACTELLEFYMQHFPARTGCHTLRLETFCEADLRKIYEQVSKYENLEGIKKAEYKICIASYFGHVAYKNFTFSQIIDDIRVNGISTYVIYDILTHRIHTEPGMVLADNAVYTIMELVLAEKSECEDTLKARNRFLEVLLQKKLELFGWQSCSFYVKLFEQYSLSQLVQLIKDA